MSTVALPSSGGVAGEFARALAAHRAGLLLEAVERYGALVRTLPRSARVRANLGAALRSLGRCDEAVAWCREAVALDPDLADAHHNLGNALATAGDLAGAAAAFARALELNPGDREARAAFEEAATRAGDQLVAAGRPREAVELQRNALAVAPDSARLLSGLGLALRAAGLAVAATDAFRVALAHDPASAAIHTDLGLALQDAGDAAGAVAAHQRAIILDPQLGEAYVNLAAAHVAGGDLLEAEVAARSGLSVCPDSAHAYSNLGSALELQGKLREALLEYRAAIALRPDEGRFHVNLAHALLVSGALAEGWREHAWRWRDPQFKSPRRAFPQPLWDGSPSEHGAVLLWGEQGIGDEVLFASVLAAAVARVRRCVLECEPRLVALLARSFPDVEVIARSDPPDSRTLASDIVAQAPIGDLPRWFRKRFEDFSGAESYLQADPVRVCAVRERLAALGPGPIVGLSWRTLRPTVERAGWYAPLSRWAPVLSIPGVTFVNLQAGDCRAELDAVRDAFGVTVHEVAGVDLFADLDSVAALIAATDVVVSQPNSVVALAGALGRPAWVLLSDVPNWRWFRDRDDSPWYPSAQLFRQRRRGDWDEVFARVATALRHETGARTESPALGGAGSRPLRVPEGGSP